MSEPVTLPAPVVDLPLAPRTKWQREYQAFLGLLPQLLVSHHGQYVAVHNEQVADSGDDKLAVALRLLARIGNVDIHVGRVDEQPEPLARSGVRRELRPGDPS
jgi:hypothetical protein